MRQSFYFDCPRYFGISFIIDPKDLKTEAKEKILNKHTKETTLCNREKCWKRIKVKKA